ncbi:MAG: hypothetical protein V4438_02890 [Patescibacteria group bacterium]
MNTIQIIGYTALVIYAAGFIKMMIILLREAGTRQNLNKAFDMVFELDWQKFKEGTKIFGAFLLFCALSWIAVIVIACGKAAGLAPR